MRAVGRGKRRPGEALLGFRLPLLSSIRSTTSARRYERMFGLKNLEGRAVFVLGAHEALSLKELVRVSGIEKAYASRTVAALVTAGVMAKEVDRNDRRAVRLTLTDKGREIHSALLRDTMVRDDEWMSVLSAEERRSLLDMLDRLTERARALAQEERKVR